MKKSLPIFAAGVLVAGIAFAQPALRLESPANGATVDNTVTLTGTAAPYSRVVVTGDLAGDVKVDRTGNWSLLLDAQTLSSGDPVDLTIVSRDARGTTSQPVTVSFPRTGGPAAADTPTDRTRLSVNVASPVNNAKVAQSFTITGTATPGSIVSVTGDAVGNATADASGNWSMNVSTRAPLSTELTLRVRARNIYNVESNEEVLNVVVDRGATPSATSPDPGTTPTPGFGRNLDR